MPEFCLLNEPWIVVITKSGELKEVSLTDALLNAHEYRELRGEMPTQDIAILRLLEAVLHSVFYYVDQEGNESLLDNAIERWVALWELGHFPKKPIRGYLEKWKDRFYLFHDKYPFYQVPEMPVTNDEKKGYGASKLNGELSESNNKPRLFASVSGKGKESLTYPEAARWLLYVNCFEDAAVKPTPKIAWLGNLGLIYAVGETLFETLMLNFVLLNRAERIWNEPKPAWERKELRREERICISPPDNQAELLTLQSRRLFLIRENGVVTKYYSKGGDFFQTTDVLMEQMTVWKKEKSKNNKPAEYTAKKHSSSRQLWRDFGSVFCYDENERMPGVVWWYEKLCEYMEEQPTKIAAFKIAAVEYGTMNSAIIDTFSDALSFHAGIIGKLGEDWQERIKKEVDNCEKLAYAVGRLEWALSKAAGGDKGKGQAKARLYAEIDQPFRRWLRSIDPETDGQAAKDKQKEWQDTAKNIALRLGDEMVRQVGEAAFVGRKVKEKDDKKKKEDKEQYYSAPRASIIFTRMVKNVYKEG